MRLIRISISLALASLLISLPAEAADPDLVADLLRRFELYASDSTSQLTILSAIALATLISEDLACIAAGLLAARGIISGPGAVTASALGIYLGDILLYLSGYLAGTSVLRYPPFRWFLTESRVRQGKELFEQRGIFFIFLSRFIPGTRTATFFGAGLLKVDLVKLLVVFAIAVIIWTPVLVLGAMLIGRKIVGYVDFYSSYAIWVFLFLVLGLYGFMRLIIPLFSWRGRRLLYSRWIRLTRWEFWPYYVTNVVTFIYVLYLGIVRYRNVTLFTSVNPAIPPDGGFIGERKSAIFNGLKSDAVGRWRFVAGGRRSEEKRNLLYSFMDDNQLDFPVVLKPDQGQRGQGVAICKSKEEAEQWLEEVQVDYIMMEFLPGEEFGVFYYRIPGYENGRIFSINRKILISVTGDGKHTLEELILRDDRALCMAHMHIENFRDDLYRIVPKGERVQLVSVGTHSRGSLFLNGSELITPELLNSMETITASYKGFYFGRYDIKAESEEALKKGENLRVIELNGVTSEATHIYDPKNSVFYAWKTLMKQWRIAFEIAAENAKRGHEPMGVLSFLTHWFRAGRR